MLLKAIMLGVWAGLCSLDDRGPQLGFRKPLPAAAVAGLLLGDLKSGLIIGATLELMWIGVGSVGAYTAPDVVAGAIVGVAMGVLSGGGVATGVALAVPASILCQQLLVLWQTIASFLVRYSEKLIDATKYDSFWKVQFLGGFFYFLVRAIPVFISVYLGTDAVEALLAYVPEQIISGLSVASKIIPAIGIAMLLTMLVKNKMWVFLILGYTLAAYAQLPLLAITLIAIVVAFLYDHGSKTSTQVVEEVESEGYDL